MKYDTPQQERDTMSNRLELARHYLKQSNRYGPGGAQAKGEPGYELKLDAITSAIDYGIQQSRCGERANAMNVVDALEEAGFRIIKAPARR
jgi:hypothetical protein